MFWLPWMLMAQAACGSAGYRIAPGDELLLHVWKDPEGPQTVAVDAKGLLHVHLVVVPIPAAGLTAEEVWMAIEKGLEHVLVTPRVVSLRVQKCALTGSVSRLEEAPIYRIRPGDSLVIRVWKDQINGGIYEVDAYGQIVYGKIHLVVGGHTEAQARSRLTEALREQRDDSRVILSVMFPAPCRATIQPGETLLVGGRQSGSKVQLDYAGFGGLPNRRRIRLAGLAEHDAAAALQKTRPWRQRQKPLLAVERLTCN